MHDYPTQFYPVAEHAEGYGVFTQTKELHMYQYLRRVWLYQQ